MKRLIFKPSHKENSGHRCLKENHSKYFVKQKFQSCTNFLESRHRENTSQLMLRDHHNLDNDTR